MDNSGRRPLAGRSRDLHKLDKNTTRVGIQMDWDAEQMVEEAGAAVPVGERVVCQSTCAVRHDL